MTPSSGACLPSIARWEKWGRPWMPSSVKVLSPVPSWVSISKANRSRAVSLPCPCWRAIFSSPPPSMMAARRAWRSSTSGRSSEGGLAVSGIRAEVDSRKSYFPPYRLPSKAARDQAPPATLRQQGIEHAGDDLGPEPGLLGLLDGGLEASDLDADDLAALAESLKQVEELAVVEAATGPDGVPDGHGVGIHDVDVEVYVDRGTVESVLHEAQRLEASADDGDARGAEILAL